MKINLQKFLFLLFVFASTLSFAQFRLDYTCSGFYVEQNLYSSTNSSKLNAGSAYQIVPIQLDFSYAVNFRNSFLLSTGLVLDYWYFDNYPEGSPVYNALGATTEDSIKYSHVSNSYVLLGAGYNFKLTERLGFNSNLRSKIRSGEFTTQVDLRNSSDASNSDENNKRLKTEYLPKMNFDFSMNLYYYLKRGSVKFFGGFIISNLRKIKDETSVQHAFQLLGPHNIASYNLGVSIKIASFNKKTKL